MTLQRGVELSRYRAPAEPGSKFITAAGHARMREELDTLWRIERPRVSAAVSEAAAQGDRSENAEYTYGKKRLREIDSRVRFLRKRLEGMTVVNPHAPGREKEERIYFGAWVQIQDDTGASEWLRIVGPDEFDMAPEYLSMDSPMGRALMRKRVHDEIEVALPADPATGAPRSRRLSIIAVSYAQSPSRRPIAE